MEALIFWAKDFLTFDAGFYLLVALLAVLFFFSLSIKKRNFQFAFIAAGLFLLNFFWTGFFAVSHDKVLNDRLEYYLVAKNVSQGRGFVTDHKPLVSSPETSPPFHISGRFLYPWLSSVVFRIFGARPQLSNLVSALFKALLAPTLFLLFCGISSLPTAFLAVFFYSLSPIFNHIGSVSLTDTTFVFFEYAFMLLVVWSLKKKLWQYAFLGGLLASAAWLTRDEGIIFVFLGALLFVFWRRKAQFLIAPLLAAGFRVWYFFSSFGFLDLKKALLSSRLDFTSPTWEHTYLIKPLTLSQYLSKVGGLEGAFLIRWGNLLEVVGESFSFAKWQQVVFPSSLFFVLLIAISFLGFLTPKSFFQNKRRRILFVVGFLFLQGLATIFFIGHPTIEPRNLLFLFPVVFFLASLGANLIFEFSKRASYLKVLNLVTVLAVAAFISFSFKAQELNLYRFVKAPPYEETDNLVAGAKWARENLTDEGFVFMTRKAARVSFYSGRPAVMVPLADFKEIMEYVEKHGVTHIIMGSRFAESRSDFVEGMQQHPSNFREVMVGDGCKIVEIKSYEF